MERKIHRTYSYEREEVGVTEEPDEDKFYSIECKSSAMLLRAEPKSYKEGDSLRVVGNQHEPKSISQLWMMKKIKKGEWEVVHVKTDLVLTVDDYQAKLEYGKQKPNQLFDLLPGKNGFLRFKDYSGCILYLDGILQANDYSERDDSQLFRLKPHGVFEFQALKDTFFILTLDRQLSVDLINASRLNQTDIVLYKKNLRMNQRWRIEQLQSEGQNKLRVYISSALTGSYMVFNREKECLTQATFPEEWRIEQTSRKNEVHIEHVKQHKYLAYDEKNSILLDNRPQLWFFENGHEMLTSSKMKLQRKQTTL